MAARPLAAIGGALVIPGGLLTRLRGKRQSEHGLFAREKKRVEEAAVLAAFNKPDEGFPAGDAFVTKEWCEAYGAPPGCVVRYLRHPFTREPDFHATSVNCDWQKLWERGTMPW